MKSRFPGYYRPSEEQFSDMWKTAEFSYDASTLLDLYRSSEETRKVLFNLFDALKDRTFITYQAALEYQRNRLGVMTGEHNAFKELATFINSIPSQLEQKLSRHSFEGTEEIKDQFGALVARFDEAITRQKNKLPDLLKKDAIREKLDLIFDGKVGEALSPDALKKIFANGSKRFAEKIPPGYMDRKEKGEPDCYGDLVVWEELKDRARLTKRPVIFVTSDEKEDWFWEHGAKTVGPRPELIEEMFRETGVQVYIYKPKQFIEYGSKFHRVNATPKQVATAATELEKLQTAQTRMVSRCPSCDLVQSDDSEFCKRCGVELPSDVGRYFYLDRDPLSQDVPADRVFSLSQRGLIQRLAARLNRPISGTDYAKVRRLMDDGELQAWIQRNPRAQSRHIFRALGGFLETGMLKDLE